MQEHFFFASEYNQNAIRIASLCICILLSPQEDDFNVSSKDGTSSGAVQSRLHGALYRCSKIRFKTIVLHFQLKDPTGEVKEEQKSSSDTRANIDYSTNVKIKPLNYILPFVGHVVFRVALYFFLKEY